MNTTCSGCQRELTLANSLVLGGIVYCNGCGAYTALDLLERGASGEAELEAIDVVNRALDRGFFREVVAPLVAGLLLLFGAACGGPAYQEVGECSYPLVWCEGDPALCPAPATSCRVVVTTTTEGR